MCRATQIDIVTRQRPGMESSDVGQPKIVQTPRQRIQRVRQLAKMKSMNLAQLIVQAYSSFNLELDTLLHLRSLTAGLSVHSGGEHRFSSSSR